MSEESGGFQRRMWQGSTSTDLPMISSQDEEAAMTDTRSWQPSAQASTTQPLLWLIVARPVEYRGAVLPIESGQIIGRRGDVRWHDARMSREHARIRLVRHPDDPQQLVYAIEPLNDRNGTLINGHQIDRLTQLIENDVIEMGDTFFVVKVLAE